MTEARPPQTLLELLLPDGRADRSAVLGSACPPRLRPPSTSGDGEAPLDLILLAPDDAESRRPGWLAQAAATCAARLSDDGLAYVLVSPRRRRRISSLLRDEGLRTELAIVHLPDWDESRHLVSLEAAAARSAFSSIVPLRPWKRRLAAVVLGLRGAGLIAAVHGPVALAARRPGARAPLSWLGSFAGAEARGRGAVLSCSWRPSGPRVVAYLAAAGAGPPVVAKVALDGEAGRGPASEGARLRRLGPAARRAGAAVPEPLADTELRGSALLVETRLEGRVLAPLLADRPQDLKVVIRDMHAWLLRWQRSAAVPAALTRARLEREVLAPAEELGPRLRGGPSYLAALAVRCAAAEGTMAPLTPSHNDLTMWNVLVGPGRALGVVDWESAEEATLPFRDFPYAVVDAVSAVTRYRNRPAAARACFELGGEHAASVLAMSEALARAVGAPPEAVELSLHACWLGHALNESRTRRAGDPAPFAEIAQWLADREATAS